MHGARVSATLRRRSEAAGLAHVGELDDRAHCDSRETSSDDCRNVHVLIEKVPGEQIVEGRVCRLREKNQREMAGNHLVYLCTRTIYCEFLCLAKAL